MLTPKQIEDPRSRVVDEAAENESGKSLESMITDAFAALSGRLQLGKNLAIAIACPDDDRGHRLHAAEARLLSPHACRKRAVNWTLGRIAASRALKQLGFEDPPPVLRGDAGEPLWPVGISGSITHRYPWSVAVAAEASSNALAVGIDLESLEGFEEDDMSNLICRKSELEWVREARDFKERLAMLFSAKEALYKSLFPFLRRYVDFREVELAWSPGRSCFYALALPSDAIGLDRGLVISSRRLRHWIFSCSLCESKSFAT